MVKGFSPYKPHRPHTLRFKGSVIPTAIIPTIVVTIVAAVVTVVHHKTSIKLGIANTFISVLGLVVGLLLTYRTNTAYDRYYEGRRLWSTLSVGIRNITRYIWVCVSLSEEEKKHEKKDLEKRTNILEIEKKKAIKLLAGFAIAVKHYLREEYAYDKDDQLKTLVSNVKLDSPDYWPKGIESSDITNRKKKPHLRGKGDNIPNYNLPLEISLFLSSYIHTQMKKKRIDAPTCNSLLQNLNVLVDCLSNFERILRTPIPLAYSIHLNQVVWIYCLSLPFQLVATTGWATIAVVFFATFVLIGIERIGAEIENPFGLDENDLDLDGFCRIIDEEVKIITSRTAPKTIDWVHTEENHPFDDQKINALQAGKLPLSEVKSKLPNSAKNSMDIDREQVSGGVDQNSSQNLNEVKVEK
ncbi:2569_t:CDS:2 [Diversispora eburnea]|uniref:2569_t:CDS:1 n=1 Tax=Diversispora eburnea TaxID=1213867 RepID=A0A9N8YMN7_9GLOM|nr:2569_t:CDS:2 [Diversispora eburnea]